ncbi:hypothetical protein ACS0TY_018794 [Phlomoides rotata]
MPDTGQGALPGLQCSNSFAILEETNEGETEMVDPDTANVVADVDDSVVGVVTITREDQLQVQLPLVEKDNATTSLSPHPAGDIGTEEHPKSRKQRAPRVAKEYNLRNRHSDEAATDGAPTHRPRPSLAIPEDNSTRPLQVMHNITRERWSDCVDDLPPKHGHTEATTRVIGSSEQVILVQAQHNIFDCTLGFIHAASDYVGRRALWQYIGDLHCNNLCLIGDFNAVLRAHERHSSHAPNGVSYADFRGFIERELLFEVEAVGAAFTWASRRSSLGLIASKLDRVLAHEGFIDHWNSVSATILARAASDHHPLLLQCDLGPSHIPRPFKFQSSWTLDSRFPEMVQSS